jgi:hypothetical protein
MPDAIDYTDPAAVLAILRPAYYALLGGSKVQEVQFHDGRRVRYMASDLGALRTEIAVLDAKVAATLCGRPRRFAIVAG